MKQKITTAICCLMALKSFGQSIPTTVNFKTPEVSAFNRFIEMPVSQYTGVPNISIPLYEINIKGINVPIKLDYHAGGIRVDQDATWVGLGWNLSYGGEISRKVRGIPDENFLFDAKSSNGRSIDYFMKLPNMGPSPNVENQGARHDRILAAKNGNADYMPDEFYYAVPGYSGRFMFNQEGSKFVLFPKEDILVKPYFGTRKVNFWNLKLPGGISIDFGKNGYTSTREGAVGGMPLDLYNSWKIKSIKNNYNDSISYEYDNFNYRITKISGQQYNLHTEMGPDMNTSISSGTIYDSKIKTIKFPTGRIEFTTVSREDMAGFALSEVNVFNLNNKLIKTIKFSYEYFYGNAYEILSLVNPIASNGVSDDYKSKRLKLKSISITAPAAQNANYSFDYYITDKIPSKYSFSQDHWGFYNGVPNMALAGLIPKLDNRIPGGDRRINPENSKVFTLKNITYPEGGRTDFVYENNTVSTTDIPNELLIAYQDDNFIEKTEGIAVSSYSRTTNFPAATEVKNGDRYFRKRFTINGGAAPSMGNGWKVSTNFGISEREKSTPYFANNVEFTLERINPDNTRTFIKSFNTTKQNQSSGGQRVGVDQAMLGITAGTYEMTVKMVYLDQPNSVNDNQPYNLSFLIGWRELDRSKNMVYSGGLRIKDISYYDANNSLVKEKSYKYVNPNAYPSNPEFTSGRLVAFPQYFQQKKKLLNGYIPKRTDWINSFSSNSILPLETTSGAYAGYEFVDEYDVDFTRSQNDIKTSYHFSFTRPYFSQFYVNKFSGVLDSKEWSRGKLLDKRSYKNNVLVRNEEIDYYYWSPHLTNDTEEDYIDEINTDYISFQSLGESCACFLDFPADFFDVSNEINNGCVYHFYSPYNNSVVSQLRQPTIDGSGISNMTCNYYTTVPYFKRTTAFDKMKSKVITTFDGDGNNPTVQTEIYNYEQSPIHYQLTNMISSGSDGLNRSMSTKYPMDVSLANTAEVGRLKLIENHQINTVLSQSVTKNNATEITKNEYKVDPGTDLVVPDLVKTNTLNGNDEVRNLYYKYDDKGNILSLGKPGGVTVNYIWSYNGQYAIAEIRNTDYAVIESKLGKENITRFSNSSPDKTAIDAFLLPLITSLPNIQVISYVYDPLVGIISQTDAKGMSTYYEYDNLQRLINIKDKDGNIIKNFVYHYAGS